MLDDIAKKAATTILDKAEHAKALHRSDLEDVIGKAIREAMATPFGMPDCAFGPKFLPDTPIGREKFRLATPAWLSAEGSF